MKPPSATFSPRLTSACQRAVDRLADLCPDLRFAAVATKDGFEIASLSSGRASIQTSVMSGTLHAVGDSLVAESQLGRCCAVILEADFGVVVMTSMPKPLHDLVLTGVAGQGANVGLLRRLSKDCCQEIATWMTGEAEAL